MLPSVLIGPWTRRKLIPKPQDGWLQGHLESSGVRVSTERAQWKPSRSLYGTGELSLSSVYLDERRTIMMFPDEPALEELLYGNDLGHEAEGAELNQGLGVSEEGAAADTTPAAASVHQSITCAGCGQQVCDRFFLLAVGQVWHGACLRCSQCHCELQTQPSLYWRDGNIYCQQDYGRVFGSGQCARCFQPIPASALVMRSGELTFHPHCFSCQECDMKLIPGNLYCMQGQNLYCQSHYHDDRTVSLSHHLQPEQNMNEDQNPASGEGEESVSSPEPQLDDRGASGRARRRTKRIRTCFRSEQLRALETYFAQKHNPDGKDWTCLAHKTGLPKRVLQVWFQNARAKLRRSLTAEDSQVNPLSASSRGVTMTTGPPPLTCSTPDPSPPFSTSTIDHLQLSLLTAPLNDLPASPAVSRQHELLQNPDFFLDYDSQNAPGCVSPLKALEENVDPDGSFRPHYC